MKLSEKIHYLSNENNIKDQYWYVVKQEWDIVKLCYAVKILESYKKSDGKSNLNLEEYFTVSLRQMKVLDENPKQKLNHRCLINAEYLGLISGDTNQYPRKNIQKNFYDIENRVDGNFENSDLYYDIIEKQIEKIYLQHRRDDKEIRKKFEIHPIFVLYKVLLLVGYSTNKFLISISEFKVFICFIEKYSDVYTAVHHLVESRVRLKETVKSISKNIDNVRINKVLSQLKTLEIDREYIKINDKYIHEIEMKIDRYETEILSKVNKGNMDNALYSEKNIFEFYKEEGF